MSHLHFRAVMLALPFWMMATSADANMVTMADRRLPDSCDEVISRTIRRFEKKPSEKNTQAALQLLERKLVDWEAIPKQASVDILRVIDDRRIREAHGVTLRLLGIDRNRKGAVLVLGYAVLALGSIGDAKDVEYLAEFLHEMSEPITSAAITALRKIDNLAAVPHLEQVAATSSAFRPQAISALAHYCRASTRPLVGEASHDQGVLDTRAAIYWYSVCGEESDAEPLASSLASKDEQTRLHALRGLIRVGSAAGCTQISRDVVVVNIEERRLWRRYRRICTD